MISSSLKNYPITSENGASYEVTVFRFSTISIIQFLSYNIFGRRNFYLIILMFRVKTSFAPTTRIKILVGVELVSTLNNYMNRELEIEITRVSPDVSMPEYQTKGAVAFDISAFEDKSIEPGKVAMIRTGLIITTPPGYVLLVASRGSGPLKLGISPPHGIGVIDQDFIGSTDEIMVEAFNITDQIVEIKKGTRIAQGLIVPIVKAKWKEISTLERGQSRGGFGSTGGHN